MNKQYVRDFVIAACAVSLGWWAHVRPVQAAATPASGVAASQPVAFQFGSIGPQTALTIYSPADHTLTVYANATGGNSNVPCTYQFTLKQPGGAIERSNCKPGSLLP